MPFNSWFINAELHWDDSACQFSIFGWAIQSPPTYFLCGPADTVLHHRWFCCQGKIDVAWNCEGECCFKYVLFGNVFGWCFFSEYSSSALALFIHLAEPWHKEPRKITLQQDHSSRPIVLQGRRKISGPASTKITHRLLQIQRPTEK